MAHRRPIALWIVALSGACSPTVAQTVPLIVSDLPAGHHATQPQGQPPTPVSITQSNDPNTVVVGASASCPIEGSQTHLWRLFDLDSDHGLSGELCVEQVDYAVESLEEPQALTVRVHCLTEGLPFVNANLDMVGTVVVDHDPTALTFHSVAVGGCCDAATEDLAIQLSTQGPGFFIGCNVLGETAPTYVSSVECGLPEPFCFCDPPPSFPTLHLILVVQGTLTGVDEVPASSSFAVLALALALAGIGAWIARSRLTRRGQA